MKNFKIQYGLIILLLCSVLGCKKEKAIVVDEVPRVTFDTSTALGQKRKYFYDQYNITIDYEWDRYAFARGSTATPANEKYVLPYMELMDELYFKAIKAVDPSYKFLDKETPLSIYLLGSGINYGGAEAFGESTVSQAGNIQPNRLTLGGVNDIGNLFSSKTSDKEFLDVIYNKAQFSYPYHAGMIGFIYHEYAHFIDSKHDIPPTFEAPSARYYLRGTDQYTRISEAAAKQLGFMIPYGMQNEHEDFATYVQVMIWKSDAELARDYFIGPEAKEKSALVAKYFVKWGLPLDKLRDHLQSPEVKARLLEIKEKYKDIN